MDENYTKPKQPNFFVNKRRDDKEKFAIHLKAFVGSLDDNSPRKIIGLERSIAMYSDRTGLSVKLLNTYLKELKQSGQITIQENEEV